MYIIAWGAWAADFCCGRNKESIKEGVVQSAPFIAASKIENKDVGELRLYYHDYGRLQHTLPPFTPQTFDAWMEENYETISSSNP